MKCVTTDARGNCNYLPVDVNEKKCALYCTVCALNVFRAFHQ